MSKVFDEEYRRLAENDIPDLWSRIEAGLNAKSNVQSGAQSNEQTNTQPIEPIEARPDSQPIEATPDSQPIEARPDSQPAGAIRSVETGPARRIRGIPFRSIRKYAGIVAACICAAIIIPAAVNRGKLSDMSAMPPADRTGAAAPEEISYEAAEADEAPEAVQEEGTSAAAEYAPAAEAEPEYVTDAGRLTDGEAASERAETAGQTTDEIVADIIADEGVSAGPETENRFDEMAGNENLTPKYKKDYQGILEDGQTVKGVSIAVIATETSESATVYYAVIREDSGQLFAQGDMISFIKTAAVTEDISVGEYYQVNLRYEEEAVYFEADAVKLYKP